MNHYERIIELIAEAGERRAYRQLRSKNPKVKEKGVKGVIRAWASRSARHPDITPDDIKKGYASGDAHPVERDKALDAAVVVSRGRWGTTERDIAKKAQAKSRKK